MRKKGRGEEKGERKEEEKGGRKDEEMREEVERELRFLIKVRKRMDGGERTRKFTHERM